MKKTTMYECDGEGCNVEAPVLENINGQDFCEACAKWYACTDAERIQQLRQRIEALEGPGPQRLTPGKITVSKEVISIMTKLKNAANRLDTYLAASCPCMECKRDTSRCDHCKPFKAYIRAALDLSYMTEAI